MYVITLLIVLLSFVSVTTSEGAPDSVIVHGSRINTHLNGEYIKLLNSSRGERKRNDRLIYRHECNPLYLFYVKHPVITNDNVPTEFWIIGPSLNRDGGYATSKHSRMEPQSVSISGIPDDVWMEFDAKSSTWKEDSLSVHGSRTCDVYSVQGQHVQEDIRGDYVRDHMRMDNFRPVYRRNVPNSGIYLHFGKYRPVWMISGDPKGRKAALWLNADCASPDCGRKVKWWKPTSSAKNVNSKCTPTRGLESIDVQIKCTKRGQNIRKQDAKTCGEQKLHKVGPVMYLGKLVLPGRWPWMAGIWNAKSNSFVCSGSLISSRRILTAGHCYREEMFVIVRAQHLKNRASRGGIEYKIRNVMKPSTYVYTTGPFSIQDDLLILELETDVIFDDFTQPLCLPDESANSNALIPPVQSSNSPYTNCYAAGWGNNGNTDSGEELLELTMGRMINMQQCVDNFYSSYPWARDKSTNCVYFGPNSKYGKICTGDSGSPLYCQRVNSTQWTVVGVASWTIQKCIDTAYIPSVYEDLTKHMTFVNQHMY